MKLTYKQYKALKKTISVWKRDREIIQKCSFGDIKQVAGRRSITCGSIEIKHGNENCPLCKAFPYCEGCPIMQCTGDSECYGTPYEDWLALYDLTDITKGHLLKVHDDEIEMLETILYE